MRDRGDIFAEIKHQAYMYKEWKRMSRNAPIYATFRQEVVKAHMRLMLACAEFRHFCVSMDQGGL